MIHKALHRFPAHTHAVTLVRDPDRVLDDETLLEVLNARGFTVIRETDLVALRHRVEAVRPWSAAHPLMVITAGDLAALPYDLWQQARRVELGLHILFPNLSYPIIKLLSPDQRARLGQADPQQSSIGRETTIAYLLDKVFDVDLRRQDRPGALIAWLDAYHQRADPMPELLKETWLDAFAKLAPFAGWPLRDLLTSPVAFATFVREQWQVYIHKPTDRSEHLTAREPHGVYLDFSADRSLQDTLPHLVRSGTLAPVAVARPNRLPGWARPALLATEADRASRRAAELLAKLTAAAGEAGENARWSTWQAVAWDWAELTALRYTPDAGLDAAQRVAYAGLQTQLDAHFEPWLDGRYTPLSGSVLPHPHHLFHVPRFMAHRYPPDRGERVALVVLDGMALADWTVIRAAWRARHPRWQLDERLVLAQVPTVTAVSRQALVSGLRPVDFDDTLTTTQADAKRWAAFWAQHGLASDACAYTHLGPVHDAARGAVAADEITSVRTRALCLVDTRIDDLVHDATLGNADFYASLKLWLNDEAPRLEALIDALLTRGFRVILTSDHGHVEARGMGTRSEGLAVETRSRRARLYRNPLAAQHAQETFPDTVLWEARGLLPEGAWVLVPQARLAFAQRGTTVMTHGGLTLDEVVVPLVTIS